MQFRFPQVPVTGVAMNQPVFNSLFGVTLGIAVAISTGNVLLGAGVGAALAFIFAGGTALVAQAPQAS